MWKLQMMQALMYGKEMVIMSKKIIDKLQIIENGVYRYLIGVTGSAPVTTLRGEIGASRVETRAMETVLMFARDMLQGKFMKVKSYMNHEVESNKGKWMKAANKYKQELGLTWEEIKQ